MKKFIFALVVAALVGPWASALGKDARRLAPYPSLEELYQEISSVAASRPELVRLEIFGRSVEGKPLYLLRFGASAVRRKPQALVAAGIHADEYIGPMVALALAKDLAGGHDLEAEQLLAQVEIDIIPSLNPDGYARVYADGGKGGEIGGRKNAHGVDLNRNFPLQPGAKSHHPLAGNRRPKSNYYMGESELCEPESRAMAELVKAGNYFIVLNLHSVAGKFLYPYTHTRKSAPDQQLFQEIGEAFAQAQKNYHYKVEQSYAWYPTLGDPDDYFYIWFGIPSFTIEIGRVSANLLDRGLATLKIFWMANPGKNYDYWIENDTPALVPAIAKAYELTAGKPLAAPRLEGKK